MLDIDTLSEREFKQSLGDALFEFARCNVDVEPRYFISLVTTHLLQMAWTCAEQFGLDAEQFAQAAMVEALRPTAPATSSPRAAETARSWPH